MILTPAVLLPDRLPSLVVLVGFWIPPALAGWVAAGLLLGGVKRSRATLTYVALAIFVLGYAAAWYSFNVGRMPPYIPGASIDPTLASPRAIRGLATVAIGLVLPGSGIACALAFWLRRALGRRRGSPATV